MNRIELCIFGGGIGILALGGCAPAPIPILDASFYPTGKGGTVVLTSAVETQTLSLDANQYRVLEECAYRKGKFYLVGHEILCDEGKKRLTPAPTEPKEPKEKKRKKKRCDCKVTEKPKEKHKPSPVRRDNGWGNGDQKAPGKSLDRNHAENKHGKEHRVHGPARKN